MTKKTKKPRYVEPEPKRDSQMMIFLGIAGVMLMLLSGTVGYFIGQGGSNPSATAATPQSGQQLQQQQIADLEAKVQQNPNSLQDILTLGHLYLDSSQVEKADEMYKKALALDSRNPDAITHIGNIAAFKNQNTAALSQYDKALGIDANYAHALYDKGVLLKNMSKTVESIAMLEKFLKLMPGGDDAKRVQDWITEMRSAPKTTP